MEERHLYNPTSLLGGSGRTLNVGHCEVAERQPASGMDGVASSRVVQSTFVDYWTLLSFRLSLPSRRPLMRSLSA
jgi:hypothetical protein